MALFGASVAVLLTFIYWSTAGYMALQTDDTIEAEVIRSRWTDTLHRRAGFPQAQRRRRLSADRRSTDTADRQPRSLAASFKRQRRLAELQS
jgi:hypothetical protein